MKRARLVDRLSYTLDRMEATVEATEARVRDLRDATKRLERKRGGATASEWFRAYTKASDTLARHVTGELRDESMRRGTNFKYQASRLVRCDYYNENKVYSGEAEDDANEALRLLGGDAAFDVRFDCLGTRRERVEEALKDCERAMLLALNATFNRNFPSEELRAPDFFDGSITRARNQVGDEKGGRLKKKRKVLLESHRLVEESVASVKRDAGLAPERLARAAEDLEAEEGAKPHYEAQRKEEQHLSTTRGQLEQEEDELVAELEARGDWLSLEVASRRRLREALEEEMTVETVIARRRCLARALFRLDRGREALTELDLACRSAKAAKCPEELERCRVDRGLLWLEAARSCSRDRSEKGRLAALALEDFEACRSICEKHRDKQSAGVEWQHAWARARYNSGLARFESGDSTTAAREFLAAASALDETRTTGDELAADLRATALCFAADCYYAADPCRKKDAVDMYRRAIKAIPPEENDERRALRRDALVGVERSLRDLGDLRAADAVAAQLGEFRQDDDDDTDDESSADESDEPATSVRKGPLDIAPPREPVVPGDAIRNRFEYTMVPTAIIHVEDFPPPHRTSRRSKGTQRRRRHSPSGRRVAAATTTRRQPSNPVVVEQEQRVARDEGGGGAVRERRQRKCSSRALFGKLPPLVRTNQPWCLPDGAGKIWEESSESVTVATNISRILDDEDDDLLELDDNLSSLSVTDCRLGVRCVSLFLSQSSSMVSLRLARCGLDAALLDFVPEMPNLERLDLSGNPLDRRGTGTGLQNLLKSSTRLKDLDVSACFRYPRADTVVNAVCDGLADRKLPLQKLGIAHNTLESWSRLCTVLASKPPHVLDARCARLSDDNALVGPTALGALVVGIARLADVDPRLLSIGPVPADRHSFVVALDARGGLASLPPGRTLVASCSRSLKLLDLSRSDQTAIAMLSAVPMPHLETLAFRNSKLDADATLDLLEALRRQAPVLCVLDLFGNNAAHGLDHDRLQRFERVIAEDVTLRSVDLSNNKVSSPHHRATLAAAWRARRQQDTEVAFDVEHGDNDRFLFSCRPG